MIGTESLPNETSILELIVDPEFEAWIPPLTDEEFNLLEKSITSEGCRDPLVVWDRIIIDGHHRYKICRANNIPFKIIQKSFLSREEAADWIDANQLGRRNLTADQFKFLMGRRYNRVKKLPGGRSDREFGAVNSTTPKTAETLASEYGVSEKTVRNAGKFAEEIEEFSKDHPEEAKAIITGNGKTSDAFKSFQETKREAIKQDREEQRRITIKEEAELPNGKYHVILADPPWQYSNSGLAWSAENQYPTLSIQEIKEIPVKDLLEENAILFMWITNPILAEGWDVIRSWGFSYKTCMVWVKESTVPGFFVNGRHELLLIATKGQMRPTGDKPNSVIFGEVERHSKKPDGVYSIIEGMFPESKRLELFARNTRDGWESWGNQV